METHETNLTLADFGHLLREERIRCGLSQEMVADRLKLSPRIIQAIECGDEGAMPHAVYARGFIRAYAGLMHFDEERTSQVCSTLADHPEDFPVHESLNIPASDVSFSARIPWFTVLLFLLFVTGGLWYFRDRLPFGPLVGETAVTEAPSAVVADPAPVVEAPVVPSLEVPDAVAGTDQPAAPVEENIPTVDAQSVDTPEPAAPPPVETVPGVHKVLISAVGSCWVHTTVDKKEVRQRTMHKGDSETLTFSDKLVLKLGNAGNIRLVYDGAELPSVGKKGQVRTLEFPQNTQN